MTNLRTQFQISLFLLSLFILAGCSAPLKIWSSKTAQVLDKNTKEPIADVYVLAKWKGTGGMGGHGRTMCYHVEVIKTDKNGYFAMPARMDGPGQSFLGHRYISIYFYKPGYTAGNKGGKSFYFIDKVHMERFKGTRKERFEFFFKHGRRFVCNDAVDSERNAYVIYKAMYEEALTLNPKSKQEVKRIKWLKWLAASVIDYDSLDGLVGTEEERMVDKIIENYDEGL